MRRLRGKTNRLALTSSLHSRNILSMKFLSRAFSIAIVALAMAIPFAAESHCELSPCSECTSSFDCECISLFEFACVEKEYDAAVLIVNGAITIETRPLGRLSATDIFRPPIV